MLSSLSISLMVPPWRSILPRCQGAAVKSALMFSLCRNSKSLARTHLRNPQPPDEGFLPMMTNNLQRSVGQVLHPVVSVDLD